MMNDELTNNSFWHGALLSALMLVGLATLQTAANVIFTMPHGRFPALMIRVMRSRAITFNAGIEGYYEQLLSRAGGAHSHNFSTPEEYFRWASGSHDRVYAPEFRISRLRPHLDKQVEGANTPQPTNSFGFSGGEWSVDKAPNTRRVALLGDSIAQGMGVDLDHTFGNLLEYRLNRTFPGGERRFEVFNFAVTSYALTQIFDVALEDAPRFKPDVYMLSLTELGFFRNWDEHLIHLIQLNIDPKYDFLRETVRNAGVSRKDATSTLFSKLEPFRIPVLRNILTAINSRAARDHASFIVVLVPSMEDGDLSKRRFSEIPGLLQSLHINFVDLLDTFDRTSDLEALRIEPDNCHPNARGHAMLADNLYAKLRANADDWAALVGSFPEAVKPAELITQGSH
jgi:hypothetical protein